MISEKETFEEENYGRADGIKAFAAHFDDCRYFIYYCCFLPWNKNRTAFRKNAREDAVKRSRAVLNGQLSEQFAAFFPDFPADPTEIRFVGKPIDFIAFPGLSTGAVDEVLFVEVKTGSAALSKVERSLRDAVEKKNVRYTEYRIPTNA